MKKVVCSILVLVLLFVLVSCDRSYVCSFDVLCSNENINVVIDGEVTDSISFSGSDFNAQPSAQYSNIDFTNYENNVSQAKVHKFEIVSLTDGTYSISLKLVDANKYVVDFLRVGIIVDEELSVYKYYDEHEKLYHKKNDPDSILHFNSENDIFNELTVNLSAGESKEIVVFIWIEESELYDENGERYTGWADKSYDASPIMLSMEIK